MSNAEVSISLASSGAEGGALSTAESLAGATTVTASLTQPLVADKLMWSPSTLPTTPKVKNEPQTPGLSTPSGELVYSINKSSGVFRGQGAQGFSSSLRLIPPPRTSEVYVENSTQVLEQCCIDPCFAYV